MRQLIKYAVAISALALAIWLADFKTVMAACRNVNPFMLIVAFVLLIASQLASAMRTRIYLNLFGLELSFADAVAFYFSGMFYNTVLPGGIGGDGYKVLILKKSANLPTADGLKLVLAERANGLFVLLLLILLMLPFSYFFKIIPYGWIFVIACIAATVKGYFFAEGIILPEPKSTSLKACLWSGVVQISISVAVLFLLAGINVIPEQWLEYLLLFQIGTVASVLPVTIGGAGLRELALFYGASEAGIPAANGVTVGVLWFVLYMLAALAGLWGIRRIDSIKFKEP